MFCAYSGPMNSALPSSLSPESVILRFPIPSCRNRSTKTSQCHVYTQGVSQCCDQKPFQSRNPSYRTASGYNSV